MMTLPRFLARLPFIRSSIYHPKITLRGDHTGVSRFGLLPDGSERDYGSTVQYDLDNTKERYLYDLWQEYEINVCAPVQVEGSDFQPFPMLRAKSPEVA